jgi:MurNAc alpha-1-phosphate uridylyltransferase
MIDTAMLLAAGFGKRMRPLTDNLPKPLVRLCDKPLIDWAMDRLQMQGVQHYVVNAHYLADQISDHFAGRDDVDVSIEGEILETGGGITHALPLLQKPGPRPFFAVNADAVWLDGPRPALSRLAAHWDPMEMDALLMLHPTVATDDYEGLGDYHLYPEGTAQRRGENEIAPYLFAGIQILSPRLFEGAPDGAFSLNLLYDKAEAAGRLHALVHDGEWYHVGTPAALEATEEIIARGHTKMNTR